ncbi:hypothetical protein [Herbaspirillum rubrisubalbicans]|uniref:hypothetical protein n=1 Tax=Herbaspirillum rubrisubalbicans TaxID=80842 RepID=UPI0015ECC7A5|nr:hypothetical protein [Herbaspirillum rubrisubalbicans]MCP1572693.1 hypothetical protein [Herbaspirillum rubrisubalbicans]
MARNGQRCAIALPCLPVSLHTTSPPAIFHACISPLPKDCLERMKGESPPRLTRVTVLPTSSFYYLYFLALIAEHCRDEIQYKTNISSDSSAFMRSLHFFIRVVSGRTNSMQKCISMPSIEA